MNNPMTERPTARWGHRALPAATDLIGRAVPARRPWLALALAVTLLSQAAMAAEYLSPIAVVADKEGKTLFVALATGKKVAMVDAATSKVTGTVDIPAAPNGLALSPDGKRLVVTTDDPAGAVAVVDVAGRKLAATWRAGHTPSAPVFSPDGQTVYLANRFNHTISVRDAATGQEKQQWPVTREPVAVALSGDGKTLFVVNLLPAQAATAPVVAAVVTALDVATGQPTVIELPNGSTGARGIALSPDGKFAYVTHTLGRYQLPTTQLERGWMNTSALSIIDVAARKLVNTVLLDEVDRGAANPWPVGCTADGKSVVIGLAGTQELLVVDRAELHARLAKAGTSPKGTEYASGGSQTPDDLAFLTGARRRLALTGNGPRALTMLGNRAYVAQYFSDAVEAVDVADPAAKPVTVALGPQQPLTAARRGEMAFFDAAHCFQQWQSCGSCHPDARVDGLNWDLLNDGIGNPKNTKSLLWAHRTPPAMSTGVRESAEKAVRAGYRFIQLATAPEEVYQATDEYLKSLTPVPSPYLVNGKLSEAAQRGEKIFQRAGCAACHPAPLFTDLKEYKVGTGTAREKDELFDTPTLVETWRTAPYLHDGRAATMLEVLKTFNDSDKHGKTSDLTPQELADLAEYVLSL